MPSSDIVLLVIAMLALLAGYPVALTLGGVSVLFATFCWWLGIFDPALFFALPSRLFGIMTSPVLIAVPLFVLMGLILEKSGIAENMFKALAHGLRHRRNGLSIAVTVVGAVMAASTGIVGASVVTLGLLALPTMLQQGVPPTRATGIIAAAGTLGQIIPPSIVLIVLGDQMSNAYQKMQVDSGNFAPETVSVTDLFAGALLPGLLLAGLFVLFQIFAPSPKANTPTDFEEVEIDWLRAVLPPILLIVLVLGSILGGIATPSEAASVGVVGALLLATGQGGFSLVGIASLFLLALVKALPLPSAMSFPILVLSSILVIAALIHSLWTLHHEAKLTPILENAVHLISMIMLIVIGASVFALVFRGLGGDATIEAWLTNLPGGTWGAIAFVMLAIFLLGFFLEFLEITYIVVPLVAPVLLAMPMADGSAMSPVWLAVLFAIILQTSFLTPPFGVSLFYLRSVAHSSIATTTIYRGIIPFVMLQVLALLIVLAFPILATWLPSHLYAT